jgi:hypothetical protein
MNGIQNVVQKVYYILNRRNIRFLEESHNLVSVIFEFPSSALPGTFSPITWGEGLALYNVFVNSIRVFSCKRIALLQAEL